tara:strand:- start:98 stop:382 length:285 start_codon:yes stop_codon:yes gene_type:complete
LDISALARVVRVFSNGDEFVWVTVLDLKVFVTHSMAFVELNVNFSDTIWILRDVSFWCGAGIIGESLDLHRARAGSLSSLGKEGTGQHYRFEHV